MRIPGPIWKRRLTSAVNAGVQTPSNLYLLFVTLASGSRLEAHADMPHLPDEIFELAEYGSRANWTDVTMGGREARSIALEGSQDRDHSGETQIQSLGYG